MAAGGTMAAGGLHDDEATGSAAETRGDALALERLAFLTDAVVAIAMTLLVIDLRVPGPVDSDADLRRALADLGPKLFSVALSFTVIGLWWVSHHRLFRSIARIDGPLVIISVAFLASIAFLPFPTSIIGEWTLLPTGVALYATTNAVAGVVLAALRVHADRARLLDPAIPLDQYRRRTRRSLIAPAVFAVSVPLAFMTVDVAMLSWNLVWIIAFALRVLRGPAGPY